jgi:autotransporter-associated beta strand protein
LASLSETVGSIAGAGSITFGTNAAKTFTAGGDNSSTTFSGVMSGSSSFTKTGSGTLTLSGDNSYTGATTASAGVIALGASNRIANTSALLVGNSGTFNLAGFDETVASIATSTTSDSSAAITLGGGTLTAGGAADTTFAGIISGSGGSVVKTGSSTLTLSGNNSFTGTTTVSAGVLMAASNNALGSASGATTVSTNAQLQLSGGISLPEIISAAGVAINQGVINNVSGSNTLSGAVTLTSSSSNEIQINSGSLTLTGGVTTPDNRPFVVDTAVGTTLTISGAGVSGSGVRLDKYGAGKIVVAADSGFGGGIIAYNNGGTVEIGGAATLGSGNIYSSTIELRTSTTFSYASSANQTVDGVISGAGAVTKSSTGTLVFAASNTYSGATTVSGGTLSVTDAAALGGAPVALLEFARSRALPVQVDWPERQAIEEVVPTKRLHGRQQLPRSWHR